MIFRYIGVYMYILLIIIFKYRVFLSTFPVIKSQTLGEKFAKNFII